MPLQWTKHGGLPPRVPFLWTKSDRVHSTAGAPLIIFTPAPQTPWDRPCRSNIPCTWEQPLLGSQVGLCKELVPCCCSSWHLQRMAHRQLTKLKWLTRHSCVTLGEKESAANVCGWHTNAEVKPLKTWQPPGRTFRSCTGELCYQHLLFTSNTSERRSLEAFGRMKPTLDQLIQSSLNFVKEPGSTLKLWHPERLPLSRGTPSWGDASHLGKVSVLPHWLRLSSPKLQLDGLLQCCEKVFAAFLI